MRKTGNIKFIIDTSSKKIAAGADGTIYLAMYARVSDEEKDEQTSYIPFQEAKCYKYIQNLQKNIKSQTGLTIKISIVKVWSEVVSSKKTYKRTAFLDMLKFVHDKSNGIDGIVVYRNNRLARDPEEFFRETRLLREAGKRLLSTKEAEDGDGSADSRTMQGFYVIMDDRPSLQAADDTFENLCRAAELGRVTGEVPYGYFVQTVKGSKEKRYAIRERTARHVRFIFESYASGLSYNSILAELKKRNVKTKRGRHFTKGYLSSILSNVKYKGWNRYNRQDRPKKRCRVTWLEGEEILVKGVLPQIVSEELWDKVAAILAKNSKGSHEYKGRDGKYILKGKIRCKCGRNMHGTAKTNRLGRQTPYYICPAHQGKGRTCEIKDYNLNYSEHGVFSAIESIVNLSDVKQQVLLKLKERENEVRQTVKAAKRNVDLEKEKHRNYASNLGQSLDPMTLEIIRENISLCVDEIKRLEGVEEAHKSNLDLLRNIHSGGVPNQTVSNYKKPNKRRLIERLVESVIIDNDKAEITLRE